MPRWAEIDGVVLRYDEQGQGELPLVLILEIGGTLESWDDVVAPLGAHVRIVRFDLRGCGLSEWTGRTAAIDVLARDIAGLLEYLRIDRRAVVVGAAAGAAVAIQFAADFAARTLGLVGLAPATGLPEDRRAAARARAGVVEREGLRPTIEERLTLSYPPALRADQKRFKEVRRRRLAAGPAGIASLTRMLAELDLAAVFARIECPTLLLAGKQDGDRPPVVVQAVAEQIRGARYKVVDTGHFMALQSPMLVADELLGFIGCLQARL
jgi:pimeloyl-ACP methyl ester carboxylesterase